MVTNIIERHLVQVAKTRVEDLLAAADVSGLASAGLTPPPAADDDVDILAEADP